MVTGLKQQPKSSGFTVVEVLVIIVVVSILATFVTISIGNWRTRTAETEVKSDLAALGSAMENAKNFGTGYPATIPSTFTASENVTVTLVSSTSSTYCAKGESDVVSGVLFSIRTGETAAKAGGC